MDRFIRNITKSYYRIKSILMKILTEVSLETDKDFKIHMEKKNQEQPDIPVSAAGHSYRSHYLHGK